MFSRETEKGYNVYISNKNEQKGRKHRLKVDKTSEEGKKKFRNLLVKKRKYGKSISQ